jgi:Tol biopolymer transport system component
MTTRQVEFDVDSWREQGKGQRKANRSRKVRAFVVSAVIGLVAIACTSGTLGGQEATTPADGPPTVAPVLPSGPFFLDLRTGEGTPLAESLAGGFNYVASPDGTRLAYGTASGGGCAEEAVTTVANIDGTGVRTVHAPKGLNICGARWSPNGSKLVYQLRNAASSAGVGNLFVQDLSSGRTTQLTHLELSRAWWWWLSPSFSPDGRNVIFQLPRSSSETTEWDVWSVPVTGGEPTLVLRNAASPRYFPDGKEIAFVLPTDSNFAGHRISTASADGTGSPRTLVAANNSIWWPTVSPGGSKIAYQDGGSIYVIDRSTGESLKVADGETAEWLDDDTLIVSPA